jgi:hypothetical protein
LPLVCSRAQVDDPLARGRKGTKGGVKNMDEGYIRRKLGITAVKAQPHPLLGRLKGQRPGATSAQGRRRRAEEQEMLCRACQAVVLKCDICMYRTQKKSSVKI